MKSQNKTNRGELASSEQAENQSKNLGFEEYYKADSIPGFK